mgnify:CR=1 FL=1|jgi:hypothetical protein
MARTFSAFVCRTCSTKLGWTDLEYTTRKGECHWCGTIGRAMSDSPRIKNESNKRKSIRKTK